MNNDIASDTSLSQDYYVLQINGQLNSRHRRYEDALTAGLKLKYQFPHYDIKVCEITSTPVIQAAGLH